MEFALVGIDMKMNTKEKLFKKINRTETCWLWIGCKDKDGYGITSWRGDKNCKTHRLLFSLFKGNLKKGEYVCHTCDVRNCVNPGHLYKGNAITNNRDTVNRGRHVSWYKKRDHCGQGHFYTKENTYLDKKSNKRVCKICRRLVDKKRYLKSKGRL